MKEHADQALDLARTLGCTVGEASAKLPMAMVEDCEILETSMLVGRIERGIYDPEAASAFIGALAGEISAGQSPACAVEAIIDPAKSENTP